MAAPVLAERLYTAEEYLALSDAEDYELDDGRLVEWTMGMESDAVATHITMLLGLFNRQHHLGYVTGAGTNLQIFAGRPHRIPRADGLFIRRERLAQLASGTLTTAPNLLIEVVSPHDDGEYLERKVQEYLSVGVEIVWVVYPSLRSVTVHRLGRFSERLVSGDTITGDEVLPGFSCPIADFFAVLD